MKLPAALASLVVLASPLQAHAHHSPAAFDVTKEVSFEGTIRDVAWTNPHVYLTVETTVDGAPALQRVEIDGPHALQTSGVTRDLLAPGTRIGVRASPNRRGPGHIVLGLDLTASNGALYPLGPRGRSSTAPQPTVPASGLAGRWAPTPAAFGDLIRTMAQAWPVTPAGIAARADVSNALAAAAACAPYPQPVLMAVHFLHEIEVSDDAVVIRIDGTGYERTIRLDEARHPADLEPTMLGHSIGRWEGETLVVDTVGFTPHPQGVALAVPSGPDKHMVERLSLTEDRLRLRYSFTLEDPEYLLRPVSYEMSWDHRTDLEPSGGKCDADVAQQFREE